MSNVINFPTEPFRKNLEHWLREFFGELASRGLSVQQQNEVFTQMLRDMGLQEIDGVWQQPPSTSTVKAEP